MRTGPLVSMMILLVSGSLICQETPSVDQMRQILNASERRGQLEMDGGAPFHLVASYEEFDAQGNSAGKGTLDELWEGPRRYRQIFTLPDMERVKTNGKEVFEQDLTKPARKLVEIDNGDQLWRTGEWVLDEPVALGFDALLKSFHLLSPTTKRISYEGPSKGNTALECIGTEPDLPDVADDVQLALTTYCMEKGNHLVHLISRPNYKEISFNDVQPFGQKYIARSIEVGIYGKVRLKLHVDVLEGATDFHELDIAPPAGAQLIHFHRVDAPLAYLTGELMQGQILSAPGFPYPEPRAEVRLVLKVHVDTTGRVESEEILQSDKQIGKAPILAMVKQWRFRVSYRGTKVVATDYVFSFPAR